MKKRRLPLKQRKGKMRLVWQRKLGEKKDDLKNQISVVEEQIKWANKEFQAAVTQGQKTEKTLGVKKR